MPTLLHAGIGTRLIFSALFSSLILHSIEGSLGISSLCSLYHGYAHYRGSSHISLTNEWRGLELSEGRGVTMVKDFVHDDLSLIMEFLHAVVLPGCWNG